MRATASSSARSTFIAVRPGGFEPPTNSLEGCCSIHLSYGRRNNLRDFANLNVCRTYGKHTSADHPRAAAGEPPSHSPPFHLSDLRHALLWFLHPPTHLAQRHVRVVVARLRQLDLKVGHDLIGATHRAPVG